MPAINDSYHFCFIETGESKFLDCQKMLFEEVVAEVAEAKSSSKTTSCDCEIYNLIVYILN